MAKPDLSMTLAQARQLLAASFHTRGTKCPCCEQFVKLYHRKLNAAHGTALLLIYKYFQEHQNAEWLQVPKFLSDNLPKSLLVFARGGDYAKLKYWGLIEPKIEARKDGSKRNGYFRITEAGKMFARGTTRIPWACWVYNGEVHKIDHSQSVSIHDILQKKFDYSGLMSTPLATGYRGA